MLEAEMIVSFNIESFGEIWDNKTETGMEPNFKSLSITGCPDEGFDDEDKYKDSQLTIRLDVERAEVLMLELKRRIKNTEQNDTTRDFS